MLVDVCRQTIVFEGVNDLTQCLKVLSEDQDVHILRIKNRLDPFYDARQSAGYRDVAMNLCISNEQTQVLCIDQHVCELQLLLKSVAEMKVSHSFLKVHYFLLMNFLCVQSDEGHKRYVTFRDLRAQ